MPGRHWPRKRVWGCAALKTPFSRLSCSSQGSHFKQKRQFTVHPLLRKYGNFSLYSRLPQIAAQVPHVVLCIITWKVFRNKENNKKYVPLGHFGPHLQIPCGTWAKKIEDPCSTASIFTQILANKPPNLKIFSSQAPKFGNFQFTSPQIWKFSVHKPPFSEANISSQAPLRKSGLHTRLPEKKLSAPGFSGVLRH